MKVSRTHHYLAAEHSEITAYCFSYKSYVTEGYKRYNKFGKEEEIWKNIYRENIAASFKL